MKADYDDVFDRKRIGAKIAERLREVEPCFVPLAHDEDEEQLMSDYDLASCVTIRFGLDDMEPATFSDPKLREHWVDLALDEGEYLGNHFDLGQYPYWIVRAGERIGTMGYWVRDSGDQAMLEFTGVYVRPQFRRQGWASRMLQRIKDVAFEVGIDRVLVSCQWGNQNALRFYLAQGMWVQSWKRDIRLYISKGEPALRMLMEGSRATFFVEDRVVGSAENNGDRLGWHLGEGIDSSLSWPLEATVPVLLTLADWPIIRNDEEWQKQVHSGIAECGDFESLALQIRRFERHLRSRGWKVPAPNPSFATLATLVGVEQRADRFEVEVSDGRCYPLPFEVLDPMPSADDPVVDVTQDDEEIRYTLRSGKAGADDIEFIFWLNKSPEHLQKMIEFWRDDRHQRAEFEARRREQKAKEKS